jgi:hypothetical protein
MRHYLSGCVPTDGLELPDWDLDSLPMRVVSRFRRYASHDAIPKLESNQMRCVSWVLVVAAAVCLGAAPQSSLRGKLVEREGKAPGIETPDHKVVSIDGERESLAVLNDDRLAGADIELLGHYAAPDRFVVGSFYTSKSMIVHKGGKRYTISYWCPVCSIRAYTPGKCVCCQRETDLDLEELKP